MGNVYEYARSCVERAIASLTHMWLRGRGKESASDIADAIARITKKIPACGSDGSFAEYTVYLGAPPHAKYMAVVRAVCPVAAARAFCVLYLESGTYQHNGATLSVIPGDVITVYDGIYTYFRISSTTLHLTREEVRP